MNEPISGIYDDDGNKINPNLIPVPGLCITCKSYHVEDWEENMLCNLNRFDQRNSVEFICGAYEKI
jgi:hypothetical protein